MRHFEIAAAPPPTVYVPYWESSAVRLTWVLRTSGNPLDLADPVRAAVHEIDPNQPLHAIRSMKSVVDESYWSWRLFSLIFRAVALIALGLAAAGIYGVMSQSVVQRSREVGIRMALGAGYAQVLRLVLWQGSKMILAGVLVGAPLAFGLGKVLAGVLYGAGDAGQSGLERAPGLA